MNEKIMSKLIRNTIIGWFVGGIAGWFIGQWLSSYVINVLGL